MKKDRKLRKRVDEMRRAAARLRDPDEKIVIDGQFLALVADLIDMEAATLTQITPFTEMMDVVIANQTGGKARLVIARDDEGEILFYSDNTSGSSRLAEYVNGK